jgi:hypothetical protein
MTAAVLLAARRCAAISGSVSRPRSSASEVLGHVANGRLFEAGADVVPTDRGPGGMVPAVAFVAEPTEPAAMPPPDGFRAPRDGVRDSFAEPAIGTERERTAR